ncbi:hypothetical protein BC829DRAFT_44967 [Chytridium lagenaria]|nr:hypothetical protein BC829DRAFT_44967 [Chytridium lagenaria]
MRSLAERNGDQEEVQTQKNYSLYIKKAKTFEETESIIMGRSEEICGKTAFLILDSLTQMTHAAVVCKRLEKIDFYLTRVMQYQEDENRLWRLLGEETNLSEGPFAVAQIWQSIFKEDTAGAVEGFERLLRFAGPNRFIATSMFPTQTGFAGIWPTLSFLDQDLRSQKITRSTFNEIRKRLFTTFSHAKPMFAAFSKCIYLSKVFYHTHCAALAVLMGKRRKAVRLLKLVVRPDMASYLRSKLPYILGVSFAAMWLLGFDGYRDSAVNVLLEYDGKALLDWLAVAKPFTYF